MEEQKEWVRHVLVVGVRDNVAEVMEHYRVVTESQGQSAQSVLPRPDNAPIPPSVPPLLLYHVPDAICMIPIIPPLHMPKL